MFDIRNANVLFTSCDREVSIITARLADQDYDTLMALGRGTMYVTMPRMALKYNLPNHVMLGLWCD